MIKSDVLDLLCDQPEDVNLERLISMLWQRRNVACGLANSKRVEDIPYEQVQREIFEWLARG